MARKTGDDWYYYLYNAHGDVIGLTDESGTVVNSYAYSPWGEIRTQTESVKNPIKYAGEYYDDELDMLYLRARYYDPQIGRFICLDAEKGSIQNPMDMNRYVYCRNNPLKYVDPTGNFFLQAAQAATNPYLHKLVWYTGAEIYLKNKGFLTSAWMLEHSLLSNPSNEYRGDSSRIAQLVKKDKSFLNALDLAISNSNGEKLNSKISVLFQEGDLYYSIHRCDIQLNGYKTSNGTWRVYGFLDDEYDYTEVLTWMEGNGASLGTIANDAAFISQIIGAIHPYHIYVHFVIER